MLSFLLPSPLPHHEIFITGLPTTLSCSFPFLIVSDQKKREKGKKEKKDSLHGSVCKNRHAYKNLNKPQGAFGQVSERSELQS